MSSVRSYLADPIGAGLGAGALLGVVEVARLGAWSRPGLAITALAVVMIAGAVVGAAIAAPAWLVERVRAPAWLAIAVRAAPTLALTIPLGATLFQGAFAATLPGAAWAPTAIPVVGWLATMLAIAIAGALRRRLRRGAAVVVAILATVTVGLVGANATLFRSGYPTVHLILVVAALAAATVGLVVAVDAAAPPRRVRLITIAAVGVVAIATAWFGLDRADDRAIVATRGDQLRHLARLARAWVDLDGDGSSAILGGGDCDDRDAQRHAGASDRPGDGIDSDCDGIDPAPPPPPVVDRAQVASLASWRAQPEVAAVRARLATANVIIVSVDALRADHLEPGDPTVPRLTALLAQSSAFSHALSTAAGTDVALTTVATGRWNPFQPIATTLAEALAASGRLTHAILPREVLRYAGETLLTRGWSTVDVMVSDGARRDVGDRITAGATTDRAIDFLHRAGAGRFALWVHYFDVHEHAQLAISAPALAAVVGARNPIDRRYRALLAGVDAEVGRLLDAVTAMGRDDDTVIVLLSDHGESLGDDPRLPEHHGLVVYHALTHVPVAVRVPGGAPRRLEQAMSLVDVPSTILGLLAVPGLPSADGLDLSDDVLGAPPALVARDRTLVMHEQDQWAVVAWPWKLLVRPADNLTELYDLSVDPTERDDRARAEPARVTDLRGRYGWFPPVSMDRTAAGRRWRERQAQRPPSPARP